MNTAQIPWRSPWIWLDLAVKVALIGLLLFAVARPDLPQFAGKAMEGRALTYPLAAFLVPALWLIFARRRTFPIAIDILVVLPFLIDTSGNALDMYDQIWWWDDANHLVNWAILAAAITLAVVPAKLPWWVTIGLGFGMGAVTAVLWELLEYITFIRNSPELSTAYTDTLGDLALGLSGSLLSASIVVLSYARLPSVRGRTG